MVTDKDCYTKYGDPNKHPNMVMWDVHPDLEIGVIPKRIYCNRDLVDPLKQAFVNLIKTGYVDDLKTWDGCFNIRYVRGSKTRMSLHSWGIAVDVNAFENGLGQPPKLEQGFVECFTAAGFDWGGRWKRPDGMHFQLSKI
jgi:hypothetical protein